jgi:hypothetical protein
MHFDDIAWLGFVRGSLTSDEKSSMEQHLTVGCGACSAAHAFWAKVKDFVAREADYEPNPSDVRLVPAAFAGEKPPVLMSGWTTLARLISDTFRDPAPAGFRSALMHARHIVFSAGQWTISLRMKNGVGDQVFLAGQITRLNSDRREPGQMEVTLLRVDSPVENVTTNGSGEFQLRYRGAFDMRLLVKVSESETLEIPLPDQDLTRDEIHFGE